MLSPPDRRRVRRTDAPAVRRRHLGFLRRRRRRSRRRSSRRAFDQRLIARWLGRAYTRDRTGGCRGAERARGETPRAGWSEAPRVAVGVGDGEGAVGFDTAL